MCLILSLRQTVVFGKVAESLGGGALLEEVGHWGQILIFYSHIRFLFTFCFLSADAMWPAGLPLPLALQPTCPALPSWNVSSWTIQQNKPFLPKTASCQVLCHRKEKRNWGNPFSKTSPSQAGSLHFPAIWGEWRHLTYSFAKASLSL